MEKVSALIDGELDANEMARQLSRFKQSTGAQESWEIFHLIGDAMRGDSLMSADFSKRIAGRLACEPTILAPPSRLLRNAGKYAMSIAASLAAVSVVAWVAFSGHPLNAPQAPAIAQLATAGPATNAAPDMIANQLPNISSQGRMNEYLLAHQEFSPSTAIQGVVPYIRSVSVRAVAQNR